MKFDKFTKFVGSDGTIFEAKNGDNWLFFGCIGMKIPEGYGVAGRFAKMPKYIDDLINSEQVEAAELKAAYVPAPDSKPSALIRKFASRSFEIDIVNKAFGFIERGDRVFIDEIEDDDKYYTALLVTSEYGSEAEFNMIYLESEDK